MQDLRTERLTLHCLSLEEMKQAMEQGDEMATDFYYAYDYHRNKFPEYQLKWLRLWNITISANNELIGGACFKGQPDESGMVEIGYGIDDEYQKKGYATEAISALVDWALSQEGTAHVMAEIQKNNSASIRVAEKNGMIVFKEDEKNLYYRK